MPFTFRSNAWLQDRANKLNPKVVSASSASGGVRNPLPSWTVSPFSATAASRLVNTTSPFRSPWITGTAAAEVARISDRIIDCPAKVIVIAAGCCAAPIAHRTANRTARQAAPAQNLPVFDPVFSICVSLMSFKPSSAISLFINILGLGEVLPASDETGFRKRVLPDFPDAKPAALLGSQLL